MRGTSGLLLIAFGLLTLYLGVTGRYKCFAVFFNCVTGDPASCGCSGVVAGGAPSGIEGYTQVSPNAPATMPNQPRVIYPRPDGTYADQPDAAFPVR